MSSRWSGKRVLITAGPTREYLDPVRFLSNGSSGKLGMALAEELGRSGARVTVVHGPAPRGKCRAARVIDVTTAGQMRREVLRLRSRCDVVIGAAAVSDWRFASTSRKKLKREGTLRVTLLRNPDIIAEAARPGRGRPRLVVGFALESHQMLEHARRKLRKKGLDAIVANKVDTLGADRAALTLVTARSSKALPSMTKQRAARALARELEILL